MPGKTCTFPTFANRQREYAATMDRCKKRPWNFGACPKNVDRQPSVPKEHPPNALALGGQLPELTDNCSCNWSGPTFPASSNYPSKPNQGHGTRRRH